MKRWVGLVLCWTLLFSCAHAQTPDESQRLVIYTSHKREVYEPIIREFESRTGLWVELTSGGTEEMLDRVAKESAQPLCDLMFGGGVESLTAYQACFAGEVEPFSSLPMVLIYNPKLTQAPTGWHDLLDVRFFGRIAFASPAVSGSSYTALATLLQVYPDESTMERFVQNLGGVVQQGSGDVVGAVASGECLIGVTLEETALKGIAAGYDIAMAYPSEGTSAVPDGVGILSGAPHPENARLFLDFILGEDLQSRLPTAFYRRSARDDSADFVKLEYDLAWASAQKPDILSRWAQLLEAKP